MKAILLASLCLIASINARPPHSEERTFQDQIHQMNQIGKINATMFDLIESRVIEAQRRANLEINSLGEPTSHMEGKIQAVIILQIEEALKEAAKKKDALLDKNEIIDADIDEIETILSDVDSKLEEL